MVSFESLQLKCLLSLWIQLSRSCPVSELLWPQFPRTEPTIRRSACLYVVGIWGRKHSNTDFKSVPHSSLHRLFDPMIDLLVPLFILKPCLINR